MKQFFNKLKNTNETIIICLMAIVGLLLVSSFYNPKNNDPFGFRCPSDFKTSEEYIESVAQWISKYQEKYPEATEEDIMVVRDSLIEKNNCEGTPFTIYGSADSTDNVNNEKLMDGIKYAESQREDQAADDLIIATDEKELYDNPYIKHVRTALNGYLDGSNNGVEEGASEADELESGIRCGLDNFDKEYYKSEFTVAKVEKNDYGGMQVYIAFTNKPDTIFWTWVYPYAGGDYTLRGFCEAYSLIKQ